MAYRTMLSIIIIIGSLIHIVFLKGIKLSLINHYGIDYIGIEGRVGIPQQIIYYGLDTSIAFSYISENNKQYDPLKSSSYDTKSEHKILSQEHQGMIFTETIQLENIPIEQFLFISLQDEQKDSEIRNAYLGIGKGKGSLIDVLYTKRLIKHRKFQFIDDSIILGEYTTPSNASCNMLTEIKDYVCHGTGIIFETSESLKIGGKGKPFDINDYNEHIAFEDSEIIFDSKKTNLCFPMKYYEAFKKKVFDKMESDTCLTYAFSERITFECNMNKFDRNFKMYLVINGNALVLTYDELLQVENRYSVMKTLKIQFIADSKDIIFGYALMKMFSVGISEEDNSVIFYNENQGVIDLLAIEKDKDKDKDKDEDKDKDREKTEQSKEIEESENQKDILGDNDEDADSIDIIKEEEYWNMTYIKQCIMIVCIYVILIGIITDVLSYCFCVKIDNANDIIISNEKSSNDESNKLLIKQI